MQTQFNPWAQGRRIKAIVGHYGSGKTEIALNLALHAKKVGLSAALVDMDIVNPFFRSAEQHALLSQHDVQLIAPPFALSGVDIPVLPAEIKRLFADPTLHAVLDVGGDDSGAAALGGFHSFFDAEPCDLLYVVNLFRPFSKTKSQILHMIDRIARRARLSPTGLINNANLAAQSSPDHILLCHELLTQISSETGIPIVMACGLPEILAQLPEDFETPLFPVQRFLLPEWMDS